MWNAVYITSRFNALNEEHYSLKMVNFNKPTIYKMFLPWRLRFSREVNKLPSRNHAVWYSVVLKHNEYKMTCGFAFWIVTLYGETVLFAILIRRQTTIHLNITLKKNIFKLLNEFFGAKISICKLAYSKEDLCRTSLPQEITVETSDRFTRTFSWKWSYIRNY